MRRILVHRDAAAGDVLLAAGVVPGLRAKWTGAHVVFRTKFPHVLECNPFIDEVCTDADVACFDDVIDLNNAYELRPRSHIVDAFAERAGVDPRAAKLYIASEAIDLPTRVPRPYVVMHPGFSPWVGRTWPLERWRDIATRFHQSGVGVVCIGAGRDQLVPCDADLRGRCSVGELATLIRDAAMFVGVDSLPMHIAQAVEAKGVAFFGSVSPELRLLRDSRIEGVTAEGLNCLGCHHRKPPPVTITRTCETGTRACESGVTVEQMWDAVLRKWQGLQSRRQPAQGVDVRQWAAPADAVVLAEEQAAQARAVHEVSEAERTIRELVPDGASFVLIDDELTGWRAFGSRVRLPCIERDGVYWGAPATGKDAVMELELQRRGAAVTHAVIAWTSFWWLEHYRELRAHLDRAARLVHSDPRMIVFKLCDEGDRTK